jgi:nucleoside-diphosphate-sugar epimerase
VRVLIIGCGYVGTALGVKLARDGHEVLGLRRSVPSDVDTAGPGIKFFSADITRPEQLDRLPTPFDWVVNCVASSGGGVDAYRQVYLQGTKNLIDWLEKRPPTKFVYTSSTSVYGQTDGGLVTETSPAEPAAEPARILVETEQTLLTAAKARNLPFVILRVAGIYGPGRGYWFKQFMKGEASIEGNGDRILNMIHRDDTVGAVASALAAGRPGEIYNVVDDEPVTQLAFFQWLASTVGKGLPPFASEATAERKRGQTNKRISNHKLKTELGYRFKYPTFREGYEAELRERS